MCPQTRYPYTESWPIEGFAMDDVHFVQVRIVRVTRSKPPYAGYPRIDSYTSAYEWWEVRLCFRPYGRSPSGGSPKCPTYVEVRSEKTGRLLKERWAKQCIARFKTEDEAKLFVHKMHQSKQKKVFFDEFSE